MGLAQGAVVVVYIAVSFVGTHFFNYSEFCVFQTLDCALLVWLSYLVVAILVALCKYRCRFPSLAFIFNFACSRHRKWTGGLLDD